MEVALDESHSDVFDALPLVRYAGFIGGTSPGAVQWLAGLDISCGTVADPVVLQLMGGRPFQPEAELVVVPRATLLPEAMLEGTDVPR